MYGVERLRGRIDYLLDLHLKRGIGSVSPEVLEILRLGAYQLLYMGGVPEYAAVSQAVDQAREAGRGEGVSKMVNGVLRSLIREGGAVERFPGRDSDPLAYLTTWGSHPSWLVRRWLGRWTFDEVERLVEADNRIPELTLRPYQVSEEDALAALSAFEVEPVGHGSGCLTVGGGIPEKVLGVLPASVQDPAAALVARYVAPARGAVVADLCAAPGGKALVLSERAAYVLAADSSPRRLGLLRENRDRIEAQTGERIAMGLVAADARNPPVERADVVLVDVPCTGTGTLRRHPDGRWRVDAGRLEALVALQKEILAGAADVVPPGGVLVYATCSLEPEENGEQVRRFLESRPDFVLEPERALAFETEDGMLEVTPQAWGFDGAFAARMRRA